MLVPWLSCLSYGTWYFPSTELLPGCQHEPSRHRLRLRLRASLQRESEAGPGPAPLGHGGTPASPPFQTWTPAACWGWGVQPGQAAQAPSITVPLAPGAVAQLCPGYTGVQPICLGVFGQALGASWDLLAQRCSLLARAALAPLPLSSAAFPARLFLCRHRAARAGRSIWQSLL